MKSHTPENALVILLPDKVAIIKAVEIGNPDRYTDLWTCGHCTVHLGGFKRREIVVEHLKSAHVSSLSQPRRGSLILTIFSGTGLPRLLNRKIYSSWREPNLAKSLWRATRLNPLESSPSGGDSLIRTALFSAWNVPQVNRGTGADVSFWTT